MPLPRRLDADECGLLGPPWYLDADLAEKLHRLELGARAAFANLGMAEKWPGLSIISGTRSPELNNAVGGASSSLHLRCPSLAADLRIGNIGILPGDFPIWQWLGAEWQLMGGRWGGTFREPDVNHFDLGVGA